MKKILIIILFCNFALLNSVHAQVLTTKQDSIVKAKIVELVKDYEFYGTLTENDKTISQDMLLDFKKLFTSNATVYNDLLKGKPKIMPINEYLRSIISTYPSGFGLTVKIKNIGEAHYVKDIGKYEVKVKILKDIFGTDARGKFIQIDGDENTMNIVFDQKLNTFNIVGIEEKQNELTSIMFTFIDVDKSRPVGGLKVNLIYNEKVMQSKITNKKGKIVFNRVPMDQHVEIKLSDEQGYNLSKIPVKLASIWANTEAEKRQIYLKRHKEWQNMSFEIFGSFASSSVMMNTVQNNFNTERIANDGKFVINGGINYAYFFKSNKKSAIGFGIGLHFDSYSSDLIVGHYAQNELPNKIDLEHDTYNLLVSSNEVSDKVQLSYIGVPLLIKYRLWNKNPMLNFIFIDAGFKTAFLASGTSSLAGNISYSGYYPSWNITIENVDYLNYYNDRSFNDKSDLDVKSILISGVASAGISISLKKPELSVIAAFDINYSLINISNYDTQNYYLSPEQKEYHSLVGASETMKPISIGFHIGILYDLFK